MKIVNPLMIALALILMLASTAAVALETYNTAGIVNKLEIGSVTINDQKYWLTPTTEISIRDINNAKLSDLKSGDRIFIQGRTIGQRRYADVIRYLSSKNR